MKKQEALVYDEIYYNYINGRSGGRTSKEISESLNIPLRSVQVQIRNLLRKKQITRASDKFYIPATFEKEPIVPPEHRDPIVLEFERYPGEYRDHPERDPLQRDDEDLDSL